MLGVLNLTMLFGAIGFAVDLGLGQFKKHAEQAAADAAALAAATYAQDNSKTCASGIACNVVTNCTIPVNVTTPFGAACVYAKANGYTNGGSGGQTVTIFANNTGTPVTGNTPSLWFRATVGESYSPLFASFGGVSGLTFHASAIAGTTATGGGSCIIALSQAAGNSFSTSGSGNITTSASCGIYDNGGFNFNGSGNISGGTTQYLGTYSKVGSGTIDPAATKAASAITDPFASVPSPAVSVTCDYTNFKITGAGNTVVWPGVYCGGFKMSGSGNVTFNSGTYIINGTAAGGKSFDITGSGNLTGANVMFYITGQNGYTAGPVNMAGSGNLTFSALSSGPYEGILFYQDRNVTYAGSNTVTGSGNVTGTWYFPTTDLKYSGSDNASYQAIVANTVTMVGSGNFQKDLTGSLTGLVKNVTALIQ